MGSEVSRLGTAKALVLLASGLLFAGATVICFIALVFGTAVTRNSPLAGVLAYASLTLIAIVVANLLSVRARTTRRVVVGGCGTLLAGTLIAITTLLLLTTR